MRVQLLPIQKLKTQDDLDVVFVPHGMEAYYRTIYAIAKEKHVFTTSSDVNCTRGQGCALAVRSNSSVEIYLNESTMHDLGFEADAAFKFMVKRI